MKKIIASLLSLFCIILSSGIASAYEESIDMQMDLTARLVTLKDQPYFTATGKGRVEFESIKDGAVVKLTSFPKLIYESKLPPKGFEALTVIITGVMGTTSTADWSNYPDVELKDLKLHIEVYDATLDEVEIIRPFISTTVSGINLSTKPILLEGVSSGGYIDVGNLEVQLAGQTIAPEDHNPLYTEHIAGEPVLLELRVKMLNLFRRK